MSVHISVNPRKLNEISNEYNLISNDLDSSFDLIEQSNNSFVRGYEGDSKATYERAFAAIKTLSENSCLELKSSAETLSKMAKAMEEANEDMREVVEII